MSTIPESSAQCIDVDENTIVVLLNYPNPVYLSGVLDVKAIRGTLEISGYNLTSTAPPVPVYSILAFNSLKVIPVNDAKLEQDTPYLESLDITADEVDRILKKSVNYSHIFIVSKSKESGSFLCSLRSLDLPQFTKSRIEGPMVRLSERDSENILTEGSEWDELSQNLTSKRRKIIVCGGKSVGKSTFLRYLINKHLTEWHRVLVLDFDPGQSEFTVMGCLSAVLVEQPLLGPNFSHIISPERCIYLGDITVDSCSRLYSESVRKLVNFCQCAKYRDIPWIVNTMGFIKGLGISLLGKIMEAIKPTDIIQIMSTKDSNNFRSPLTPSFFHLQKLKREEGGRWKPQLHVLPSMAESTIHGARINHSAIRRDIVTIFYLRRAMKNEETDLMSVTPKKIQIDDIQIMVPKPASGEIEMKMTTDQKLCCINANLVALCIGETIDRLDCLGFGIVRGFDLETNRIYVITPLSEDELKRVTVLKMSSSIQLPQAVYKDQADRIKGPYPYVNYKVSDKLNQPIKKTSGRMRFAQESESNVESHESTQ